MHFYDRCAPTNMLCTIEQYSIAHKKDGDKHRRCKEVLEPLLNTLRIPYQIVDRKDAIERSIQRAHFACRDYETPVALLLTGEVLW